MARFVISSGGRLARLARRMTTHKAAKNPRATRVPYVGRKKLPIEISFGSMAHTSLLGPPHIQQQQASSDGYGAVGHVKGRKIMRARVHFDKIRHRTVDNSIIQVSESAAQDERERGPKDGVARRGRAQKHERNRH